MIILNEKEYAEKCLNEDVINQDKNPYQVVSVLAKYYYHICGYRKKKIYGLLIEYLKKYYPRYEMNIENWEKNVSKLATNAGKEDLFEISGVKITKPELLKIQSVKNKAKEKLLFTMLCVAKLNMKKNPNSNGWVNVETREIFSMARVSCTSVEQDIKIGEFRQLGLLELPKKNGNLNFRVTFIDDDGDEELFVSDFRELGYEYLKYIGEDFIRCQECGVLTRQVKNKTKKYCDSCKPRNPKKDTTSICVDCGKLFIIRGSSKKISRCNECQDKRNRKKSSEWRQHQYYCNIAENEANIIANNCGFDARDYVEGGKYYKEYTNDEIVESIKNLTNELDSYVKTNIMVGIEKIRELFNVIILFCNSEEFVYNDLLKNLAITLRKIDKDMIL